MATCRETVSGRIPSSRQISAFTRLSICGAKHRGWTFRAEAFNILNKANYQAPDTNISDGAGFGVITTAYPARQLQLALKLLF